MMRGARTHPARAARHDLVGFGEMPARALDDARADLAERRARQHRRRIGRRDAGLAQRLRRQIEPSDRRILIEVAQDIGELQRPPQMMRERDAVLLLHAEDADREPPDRARDPIAIGVERRVVGRADVGDHVHFHAVDDGMEILAPEPEIPAPARRAPACAGPACRHRAHRYRRASGRAASRRASRGPLESAMSSTCRQKE